MAKITIRTINNLIDEKGYCDVLQIWRDRDRSLIWGSAIAAQMHSSHLYTCDADGRSIEEWSELIDEVIEESQRTGYLADRMKECWFSQAKDALEVADLHDWFIEMQDGKWVAYACREDGAMVMGEWDRTGWITDTNG